MVKKGRDYPSRSHHGGRIRDQFRDCAPAYPRQDTFSFDATRMSSTRERDKHAGGGPDQRGRAREDKIAAIRQAIEDGTYAVSAELIADRILAVTL